MEDTHLAEAAQGLATQVGFVGVYVLTVSRWSQDLDFFCLTVAVGLESSQWEHVTNDRILTYFQPQWATSEVREAVIDCYVGVMGKDKCRESRTGGGD